MSNKDCYIKTSVSANILTRQKCKGQYNIFCLEWTKINNNTYTGNKSTHKEQKISLYVKKIEKTWKYTILFHLPSFICILQSYKL